MGWKRILGLMGLYPIARSEGVVGDVVARHGRRCTCTLPRTDLDREWCRRCGGEITPPPGPPVVPAHQQPCTCLIYQGRRSVNVACPIHGATTPLGGLLRGAAPHLEGRPGGVKVQFKWYDLWVGVFFDTKKRRVYVCPLPCVVVSWGY